jgi:hypothetical protein
MECRRLDVRLPCAHATNIFGCMDRTRLIVLLGFILSADAFAADESEEFIVTIALTDKSVIPGASLRRSAAFILQQVKISNDSRGEQERAREILETQRAMAGVAAKEKGIVPGGPGEVIPPPTTWIAGEGAAKAATTTTTTN